MEKDMRVELEKHLVKSFLKQNMIVLGNFYFLVLFYFIFQFFYFINKIRYVPFDFHHECKNMRWDRLSRLIDQISDDLDKQGYYSIAKF